MSGFLYGGVHSSDKGIYRVTDVRGRGVLPPIEPITLEVPGRDGAYYQGHRYGPREIQVDVVLAEYTQQDVRATVRSLAAWLAPDGGPRELVFDDEPDKTWLAVLSDTDLKELVLLGTGTLTFLCAEPFALGDEVTVPFSGGLAQVNPGGTAPTWPIITVTAQQALTYLAVAAGEEYVLLGRPEGVEEAPAPKEELVLHDTCSTLTGWGPGTEVLNGTVSGSMATSGSAFYVGDYGSGAGWHGPAIKRSIPVGQVQDFRLDVLVIQQNTANAQQTGRAEVYLLGPNNEIVGMISVRDRWVNDKRIEVRALMGNASGQKDIHVGQADNPRAWNDFSGIMRLQRVGKTWLAYWALTDSKGRHHTRRTVQVVDAAGAYQTPVTQVLVYMAKYGDGAATTQNITDIKVWRFNTLTPSQVPYIAQPGDVLEVDCERHVVRLNGEPRLDLLDPVSRFFSLTPGQPTTVGVEPASSVTASLTYRERWL